MAMLVAEDGLSLELVDSIGLDDALMREMRLVPLTARVPNAEAMRTGRPVWIESAEAMKRHYPEMKLLFERAGLQALAIVPIVLDDEVLGELCLGFDEAGDFSVEEKTCY